MKRDAYQNLLDWKNSAQRKPLLLQGARQVGKTYLVNKFGKKEYSNYIYLNFEQTPGLASLFAANLEPFQIINNISLYIGQKIIAEDTLIFFDEIQTVPAVLTSLKYFQEQAGDFHVIAAGSLLGVSVGKSESFPVGKVNFLTLYPMSFMEFLRARGNDLLSDMLLEIDTPDAIPELLHKKLLDELKLYLYVGGMPEVLQSYIDSQDIALVRSIQNDILEAYSRDFSKYTEANQAIKTAEIWRSIPRQLAKENKKFKYSDVTQNARSANYELTIEWLAKAGLINLTYNIETPKLPLSAYADYSKFKIYLHDVGLLAAMLNVSSDIIVTPGKIFSEFNGAFIENFIAQQLLANGQKELYYWTSRSDAEVDFLIQQDDKIIPLEIKSGLNRNIKSIRSYAEKYKPEHIFRLSPRNFMQSDDFVNLPLYASFCLNNLFQNKELQ